MVEKWYAIMTVVMVVLNVGISLGRHGEVKKQEKYNAWTSWLVACIVLTLAWLGGLFRCFK
jgi:ammonia channel protein AmtB